MPIQTAFNAGEFSPLMGGDIDYQKRQYSVSTLKNMIALKQGPATRRGATVYVSEVIDSANRCALLSFESSDKRSYIIEVSDLNFRIYKDYAQVESGGSPIDIVTPYAQADLFDDNNVLLLQTAQSADVLYIVHPDYPPYALSSTNDTTWTLTEMSFSDGPYLDENSTTTTMSITGGTVTASSSVFSSTDVGRLLRIKDGTHWDTCKITGYTSGTSVTVFYGGHTISATTSWRLGVYSDTTGYPSCITFFQDRVALAKDDRYDMTTTGGYSPTEFAFAPSNSAGDVADDNAISGRVPSGLVNTIQWMSSNQRGLVIGTSKEEFLIRASNYGEALTPSNATSTVISGAGGSNVQSVRTMFGSLFIQQSRRKVYDMIYDYQKDSLAPQDLTLAAEHITRGSIIGAAYQREPINVIWFVKDTGEMVGMTHYPDQDVFAWHRHTIGGVSDVNGNNSIVESIAVIPSPSGDKDDLWMIVKRYINGQTVRYIEYLRPYCDDDIAIENSACCDSRFTYDSTATSVVTGLSHLEGETVKVMVDGKSHPDLTVSSGSVTLANGRTGSKIHIGLAYTWQVKTRELEIKLANGDTAQGKTKRVSDFILRLYRSLGIGYGKPDGDVYEYDFEHGQEYNETPSLFTGDTDLLSWPDGSDKNMQLNFTSSSVFPVTIVAIMFNMKVQG